MKFFIAFFSVAILAGLAIFFANSSLPPSKRQSEKPAEKSQVQSGQSAEEKSQQKREETNARLKKLNNDGNRLLMAKEYYDAEICFTQIIEEPNCHDTLKNNAYFYRGLSRSWGRAQGAALDDYAMAIKLGYADPIIYKNRAICFERLGRQKEAKIEWTIYNQQK